MAFGAFLKKLRCLLFMMTLVAQAQGLVTDLAVRFVLAGKIGMNLLPVSLMRNESLMTTGAELLIMTGAAGC